MDLHDCCSVIVVACEKALDWEKIWTALRIREISKDCTLWIARVLLPTFSFKDAYFPWDVRFSSFEGNLKGDNYFTNEFLLQNSCLWPCLFAQIENWELFVTKDPSWSFLVHLFSHLPHEQWKFAFQKLFQYTLKYVIKNKNTK